VIFSCLSFALCAALLCVQFGLLGRRNAPAESAVQTSAGPPPPPPAIQPAPPSAPATAAPDVTRGPSRDSARKQDDAAAPLAAKGKIGSAARGADDGAGDAASASQPRRQELIGHGKKSGPGRGLAGAKNVDARSAEQGEPPEPSQAAGAEAKPQPPPQPAQAASEALASSVLKVNVPAKMIVGQSEHLRAVIGTRANSELVAQEVALGSDAGHPQVQIGRNLMLSQLVRMDLRSDSASDFDISPKHPAADQVLTDNDVTIWEWAVTPKVEGLRHLTLTVSNLRESNHELLQTKIYPVNIEVEVTAFQRIREVAVAGSSVLSALAGLVGAWLGILRPLLQRRRPDGDGDAGGTRPRTSGTAPPGPQPPRPVATTPEAAAGGEPPGGPQHQFTD
jgi:hypothetical protein